MLLQINDAGGLKKLLFNWGFARKLYYLKEGISHTKVLGCGLYGFCGCHMWPRWLLLASG